MTWDPRPASPRWTTTVETDRPRAWRNRTALCDGAAPKCRAGRPRRAAIALDVLLSNSVLRRPSRPVLANRPIEPPAGRSPSTCRRVYRGPATCPRGFPSAVGEAARPAPLAASRSRSGRSFIRPPRRSWHPAPALAGPSLRLSVVTVRHRARELPSEHAHPYRRRWTMNLMMRGTRVLRSSHPCGRIGA